MTKSSHHKKEAPRFLSKKQQLLDNLREEKYAGYDPFDGLNSRLLKVSRLDRFSFVRLAWIQLFKRLPVNLRPLVGVPKCRNAKGIALIILGMLKDYTRTREQGLFEEAICLGDWLLEHGCAKDEWKHDCWGYPFPWQARAFFVPVGTPNIITTCYVARALWALSEHSGDTRYSAAANSAASFIAENLYVEKDGKCFLAYIPGGTTFVHNANLWGAAVLAQAYALTGCDRFANMALRVARQSVDAQLADGSWPYGTRSHHHFIDSFHTGYNLEALDIIRLALNIDEFDVSIASGLEYYRQHFFLPDGTPKYYNNSLYPIDMHSISQAVLTLSRLGNTPEDHKLIDQVMAWAVLHMYNAKTGWFYYQIHRRYRNKIPYLRWTQAWAYLALVTYEQMKHSSDSEGKRR